MKGRKVHFGTPGLLPTVIQEKFEAFHSDWDNKILEYFSAYSWCIYMVIFINWLEEKECMTAVGFEPTPFRTGA